MIALLKKQLDIDSKELLIYKLNKIADLSSNIYIKSDTSKDYFGKMTNDIFRIKFRYVTVINLPWHHIISGNISQNKLDIRIGVSVIEGISFIWPAIFFAYILLTTKGQIVISGFLEGLFIYGLVILLKILILKIKFKKVISLLGIKIEK